LGFLVLWNSAESSAEPIESHRIGHRQVLPSGAIGRLGTISAWIPGFATAFAYSPTGDVIAVAYGKSILRWDAETGRPLADIPIGERVVGFAFFPGGKSLAVVTQRYGMNVENEVSVVDLSGKREFSAVATRAEQCLAVAVSADGRFLAYRDLDRAVCVRDMKERKTKFVLKCEEKTFSTALCFSPDARYLVAAKGAFMMGLKTDPADVYLWDLSEGRLAAVLAGHREWVSKLSFSADGALLLSVGIDGTARVWDVAKRKEIQVFQHVSGAALSPDGVLAFVGSTTAPGTSGYKPSIDVWDVRSGKRVKQLVRDGVLMRSLIISPDGKRIAGEAPHSAIGAWDVATGKYVFGEEGHRQHVGQLVFAPDSRTLASLGADRSLRVWDVARASERYVRWLESWVGEQGTYPCLAFSHDGSTLTALSGPWGTQTVRVWNVANGNLLIEWAHSKASTHSLGLLDDDKVAATASTIGVHLWSQSDGKLIGFHVPTVDGRQGGPYAGRPYMSVQPGGRLLATAPSGKSVIQLYDYSKRRQIREIATTALDAEQIVFAGHGHWIASAGSGPEEHHSGSRRVSLWETATGARLGVVGDGKGGPLMHVAASPDGRLIATAEKEKDRIRVWHVGSGKELAAFEGSQGTVYCLAFSPDGKLLATGGEDGNILLWDVSKLDRSPGLRPEPKDVEAAWSTLTGKGGPAVLKSIYTLAAAGNDAVALIRGKVRAATEPDADVVRKLLKNLDDDAFEVRKDAAARLEAMGDAVRPALERAQAAGGSAELMKQLKRLLESAPNAEPTSEQLRSLRAVWVLEEIGTPAARDCLKTLANVASGDQVTTSARDALARLERRVVR
jgi:WD40 repeat protein